MVLFVDDDPALLESLRVALRREMFEVLIATSARAGLEVLARNRVDVVVSDQCMPGIDGVELLRMVREFFPDTIRILLSGQSGLGDVSRAVNEAGIRRFLLKPCEVSQLVDAIDQAMVEEVVGD